MSRVYAPLASNITNIIDVIRNIAFRSNAVAFRAFIRDFKSSQAWLYFHETCVFFVAILFSMALQNFFIVTRRHAKYICIGAARENARGTEGISTPELTHGATSELFFSGENFARRKWRRMITSADWTPPRSSPPPPPPRRNYTPLYPAPRVCIIYKRARTYIRGRARTSSSRLRG